jgi:hypothetical protein
MCECKKRIPNPRPEDGPSKTVSVQLLLKDRAFLELTTNLNQLPPESSPKMSSPEELLGPEFARASRNTKFRARPICVPTS